MAVNLTNLTGRTDVSLDFWAKYAGGSYAYFYVELSGDGTNFGECLVGESGGHLHAVHAGPGRAGAANGIALDGDVYIRFRDYNPSYDSTTGVIWTTCGWWRGWTWRGRKCCRTAPATLAAGAGPLTNVGVTFNEPIDPASFTAADVVLKDAQGSGDHAGDGGGGGQRRTAVQPEFCGAELRGTYRLSGRART